MSYNIFIIYKNIVLLKKNIYVNYIKNKNIISKIYYIKKFYRHDKKYNKKDIFYEKEKVYIKHGRRKVNIFHLFNKKLK